MLPPDQKVYSISQLNNAVRTLLEERFATVWVEAEISNLVTPRSGHMYFSLKDAEAQVRCAMFRHLNSRLGFVPKDGMQVLVRAKVSLYAPRGDYQLIAEYMEEAGLGALQRKFEELKCKLQAEGLFEAAHKQLLPELARCIGVVTSATGAAVHDVLTVLKRRFPALPVIIYPTQVQGAEAARQIVAALNKANQRQECDVLLLVRGGGSLEDLWPFNEEVVARAIFASEIPVVSGVGHEVDFTIADFVADKRAPTPSAAAELVSPDVNEWLAEVKRLSGLALGFMQNKLQQVELNLMNLAKRLRHPGQRIRDQVQYVDQLEQRLYVAINNLLRFKQQRLQNCLRSLSALSPLNTLERGYAIVADDNGCVVTDAKQVNVGDMINIRLAKGKLLGEVKK